MLLEETDIYIEVMGSLSDLLSIPKVKSFINMYNKYSELLIREKGKKQLTYVTIVVGKT